ncbi:porin family protein [Halosquirtibacter xylanolyticus]|uniref:hypothetical protein n=1 Tax=Halosquirtibacter xylanolyticus TaxID=3374599 RepID=UPI003749683A|nr:porin family protein [Prolixibacteraceae bacterium]
MKKIFFSLMLVFTFTINVCGQGVYSVRTYADTDIDKEQRDHLFEIMPMVGFQFGGKINFVQGKLDIKNDMMYGISCGMQIYSDADVEFAYSRMDTRANFNSSGVLKSGSYNLSVDYFQLGYLHYLKSGQLRPFGLISVGATLLNSKDDTVSDTSLFSMALGGGIKYYINDKFGLRLQGRLLMPMYFNGAGFMVGFNGAGSFTSVGVSATEVLVQGDLSVGVIYRFGS